MAQAQFRRVVIADFYAEQLTPLANGLVSYGFDTVVCHPQECAEHAAGEAASAVVVGPSLSALQIWELCRQVRRASSVPVLVLTDLLEPEHVALTLDAGADQCLPASAARAARAVISAIQAVERREHLARREANDVIHAGGLNINLARKEVELQGQRIVLTPTEFGILEVLARQPGKVVSAAEILRDVHGYWLEDGEAQDIVKVHISRLRQKLEEDPQAPSRIVNVRGRGYMYMFERRVVQAVPAATIGSER